MPVTTRSQAKKQQASTINVESTINVDSNINVEPKKKEIKTFDYLYKDKNTGIEYITKTQFEERWHSEIRPNIEDIQHKLPMDIHAYQKITEILPSYLENVPEHIRKQKDIYVIPPRGQAWKERNSYTSTSYFHLDDYWVLVKIPSKKR